MTALDPSPRALPEIGRPRFARDVRTGWHVLIDGAWHYVISVVGDANGKGVTLILREGFNGERDVRLSGVATLATRTPAEQIQWIEASRVAAHGGGPVSRLALDQATKALLADMPRCPACGGLTGWEDGA